MTERKVERRGLGRGLSALMADIRADGEAGPQAAPDATVPIERIRANPAQPRRDFPPEALAELAESIRQKGVLQPVILRPLPDDAGYELVAGERRWRAAQMAQLHAIPAIVRSLDDAEVLEIAIIENVQRADLNPIEEAAGYAQLIERFGHTQEQIADALAKSRSHIANLLRLLKLPPDVQGHVRAGRISSGHARALVTMADPVSVAQRIIVEGLSVRETETLARDEAMGTGRRASRAKTGGRSGGAPEKDADTRALEADLSANLGMAVSIQHEPGGERGRLTITYNSLQDLDDLCRALSSMPRDGVF
ncbi:MAG: ParB/RepB/Spo0J family partition protein [Paracoccaceae bacterium]|nr:MAG: ParB/RepB/Spo0J family partition protein [Paracoccaceae bacterium]